MAAAFEKIVDVHLKDTRQLTMSHQIEIMKIKGIYVTPPAENNHSPTPEEVRKNQIFLNNLIETKAWEKQLNRMPNALMPKAQQAVISKSRFTLFRKEKAQQSKQTPEPDAPFRKSSEKTAPK